MPSFPRPRSCAKISVACVRHLRVENRTLWSKCCGTFAPKYLEGHHSSIGSGSEERLHLKPCEMRGDDNEGGGTDGAGAVTTDEGARPSGEEASTREEHEGGGGSARCRALFPSRWTSRKKWPARSAPRPRRPEVNGATRVRTAPPNDDDVDEGATAGLFEFAFASLSAPAPPPTRARPLEGAPARPCKRASTTDRPSSLLFPSLRSTLLHSRRVRAFSSSI